jgi:hypothetical protein
VKTIATDVTEKNRCYYFEFCDPETDRFKAAIVPDEPSSRAAEKVARADLGLEGWDLFVSRRITKEAFQRFAYEFERKTFDPDWWLPRD